MLFNYDNSQITKEDIKAQEAKLVPYITEIKQINATRNYTQPESSINLPFDNDLLETLKKIKDTYTKTDTLILVGIGGSNLGTQAIYEALDRYNKDIGTEVLFLDTLDSNELYKIYNYSDSLDLNNILVIAVTKSGKTTETIVNLELLLHSHPQLRNNLVVISDGDTNIAEQATEKNIDFYKMPKIVGGRFSVFSSVGMIPISILKYDYKSIFAGAKQAVLDNTTEDIFKNNAAISAICTLEQINKGKVILDFFTFNKELETLGKWHRQLYAESLGKQEKGIFPTVSVGTTDLHSVTQRVLGGPQNIFTNFVIADFNKYALSFDPAFLNEAPDSKVGLDEKLWFKEHEPKLPDHTFFKEIIKNMAGKSASDIKNTIYQGVKNTYIKKSLPFTEYILEEVSETELGYFMQFKMLETMYLGKLLEVNTFDQPNVEDYKSEVRNLMENNNG
jgi:glucose-6-phosphate isomerase